MQYVEGDSGVAGSGYQNSGSTRKGNTTMEKRGSITQPHLQINDERAKPERRFLPNIINST